jgi:excisionase family DNA binding protein
MKLVVTTEEQLRTIVDEAVSAAVARLAPSDRPLDLEEVADLLGICTKSVLTHVRTKGLPARKVGKVYRFFRQDVLDWLAEQKAEAS